MLCVSLERPACGGESRCGAFHRADSPRPGATQTTAPLDVTHAVGLLSAYSTIEATLMNNKSAITSTVGYMCLALTGWMLSMSSAGWFDKVHGHGSAMMYPLAIVLVVMGILSFLNEGTLDAIIFFAGAGLFWVGHEYRVISALSTNEEPLHYTAWYYFIWAVFFAYVWLGAFNSGVTRMLFLLGLWLTLLALAVGNWTGSHTYLLLAGYIGLITAILAAITSAMAVLAHRAEVVSGRASSQPA
jgi:uncharacterized protein